MGGISKMRLTTLVSGLFLGATLAYGGTAVAQSRVCAASESVQEITPTEVKTEAAHNHFTTLGIRPKGKFGVCLDGKCRPCLPGLEKYTIFDAMGNEVYYNCPDQKAISGKPSCYSQFDNHGTCLSKDLAGAFGLTEKVDGYCTGSNTSCYNTKGVEAFATVADLKTVGNTVRAVDKRVDDVIERLDTAGGKEVTLERALAEVKLSDLETFAVSLHGDQCKEDYARLQGLVTDVRNARDARDTAANGLKECLDKVPAQEGKVPVGRELLAYANQGAVPACPDQSASLKDKNGKYEKTFDAFKTAVDFVKEHGCNYKAPAEPKKQGVQYTVLLGYAHDLGQGTNAPGFSAQLQVSADVLKDILWLGGYVNSGYSNASTNSRLEEDLGFATQLTEEARTVKRFFGAGGLLEVKALPNDYLNLDFMVGAAWKRDYLERTTTVAGKSNHVDDSENRIVGEFGLSVTSGYGKKDGICRWVIGPSIVVDTDGHYRAIGATGFTCK